MPPLEGGLFELRGHGAAEGSKGGGLRRPALHGPADHVGIAQAAMVVPQRRVFGRLMDRGRPSDRRAAPGHDQPGRALGDRAGGSLRPHGQRGGPGAGLRLAHGQ